MKNKNQKIKLFYAISLGSELGFLIALPLILFLLLGLLLDKKFNTLPLFLVLFIILGLVATIFELRFLILPFLEKKVAKKNNQ